MSSDVRTASTNGSFAVESQLEVDVMVGVVLIGLPVPQLERNKPIIRLQNNKVFGFKILTSLNQSPNGSRYPLVCFDRLNHQAGQDKAILTEPTSSQEKCLKTRTPSLRAAVPPPWPRRTLSGIGCSLCWAAFG
jgi:hypothetical protein